MNQVGDLVRLVIISVPPQPLLDRLGELRAELCRLSGSRAALAWPVHLTLRTGALVPQAKLPEFYHDFGAHAAAIPAFSIRLGRFVTALPLVAGQAGAGGQFAGFEVEMTPELAEGHRRLAGFEPFRKGRQYDYHPHVTLAFDDLDQSGLERIRQAVEGRTDFPIGESWNCQAAECFRQTGQTWERTAILPLQQSGMPWVPRS